MEKSPAVSDRTLLDYSLMEQLRTATKDPGLKGLLARYLDERLGSSRQVLVDAGLMTERQAADVAPDPTSVRAWSAVRAANLLQLEKQLRQAQPPGEQEGDTVLATRQLAETCAGLAEGMIAGDDATGLAVPATFVAAVAEQLTNPDYRAGTGAALDAACRRHRALLAERVGREVEGLPFVAMNFGTIGALTGKDRWVEDDAAITLALGLVLVNEDAIKRNLPQYADEHGPYSTTLTHEMVHLHQLADTLRERVDFGEPGTAAFLIYEGRTELYARRLVGERQLDAPHYTFDAAFIHELVAGATGSEAEFDERVRDLAVADEATAVELLSSLAGSGGQQAVTEAAERYLQMAQGGMSWQHYRTAAQRALRDCGLATR